MKRIFMIFILVALTLFSTFIADAQVCPYIPYFSQLDSRWAKNQLGTCSGETTGKSGCVITCVSMVFKYYDRKLDIDPGKLNEWLKKNNGYANGCEMIWSAPSRYTKGIMLESTVDTKKLSDIDKYLNRTKPVIVKVLYCGLPHYVVVSYKYRDTYYIQDPNGSSITLNYYKNSITRLVVYSPTGAPPKPNEDVLTTTWGAMKQ